MLVRIQASALHTNLSTLIPQPLYSIPHPPPPPTLNATTATIFSFDMHHVADASPVSDLRTIATIIGQHPRASLWVCSYSPVTSPFRQRTYKYVQSSVRFSAVPISLVQTAGKSHGEDSKASFFVLPIYCSIPQLRVFHIRGVGVGRVNISGED